MMKASSWANSLSRRKAAYDAGSMITDCAKMIGMTPAVLMRSGRCVVRPVIILRPTMRRAYCTGMRRWPWVIMTVSATTATMTTSRNMATNGFSVWPTKTARTVLMMSFG
jgi:hypothetical protein